MAAFTHGGMEMYYEEYGEGAPLIVVNGIFMSTVSWAQFIPAFSARNKLILFDLLDQGKSAYLDHEYENAVQADVLKSLIEHIGAEKAHICGISYGGEVAMQFAAKHPGMVDRLVLSNTTAYTNPWLEDIGDSWEYAVNTCDGDVFFKTCIPIIYSPNFYAKNIDWARKRGEMFKSLFTEKIYGAFGRLIRSAKAYDMREKLSDIKAPTLVVSSEFDFVTPLDEQKYIAARIPGAAHALVPDSGHALMYEKPKEFVALTLGFINA